MNFRCCAMPINTSEYKYIGDIGNHRVLIFEHEDISEGITGDAVACGKNKNDLMVTLQITDKKGNCRGVGCEYVTNGHTWQDLKCTVERIVRRYDEEGWTYYKDLDRLTHRGLPHP